MSEIDWLKERIAKDRDTLDNINQGVLYFRRAATSAQQETTGSYKTKIEDRIARCERIN